MASEMTGPKANRRWHIGWTISVIVFALVVTWQNRGLSFFWDEWDVVSATLESPYYGILQDNGGNFFPLSRVVFGLELAIFGTWYPGYMLITSLLFGSTALTFNLLLDDGSKLRRIVLSSFALIYLSSTGVLFASSMGFMLKWGLSPLLAIASASFFVRSREAGKNSTKMLTFGWIFFILSWASFSSSIVIMSLLIVGLIYFAPQASIHPDALSRIKLSLGVLTAGAVLALVGIRIAALNPPANPLIANAQGVFEGVLIQDPLNSILLALAATLAGLASVIIAAPLHNSDLNSWLIIAFRDYLVFVVGLIVVIVGVVYVFKRSLPNRTVMLLFALLFIAMAFITVTRTPFIHRYQSLWVLIAILVILSVLSWLTAVHLTPIRNLVVAIVIVAGLLSSWQILTHALNIANIEKQRDVAESVRLTNPISCVDEANESIDQIAPTITTTQLCSVLEVLQTRNWILERQVLDR